MQFQKIRISKDEEVEIIPTTDVRKHTKHSAEVTGVNPLPSFKDAHAAFLPLFLRVVPQLESVKDHLRVSTLSLSEKDGDRSLQISATLSIDACGGAGISMTTPRLIEPPEGAKDGQIYLTKTEMQLIETVEAEAERYFNDETAQTEMPLGRTANERAVDQKMADAEVSSTRKPRAAKKAEEPDTAKAANAKPEAIRAGLAAVGKNVPLEAIKQWGTDDRAAAIAWANNSAAGVPANMPLCVQRDARQTAAGVH
jgi:hypothetical protein